MKKTRVLVAFVIAITLTFASCGQKIEEPKKEKSPLEKAALFYEEQIKGYENIDFAIDDIGEEPTYDYEYAFLYMNDDEIPELLINKINKSYGLAYSKIFYYDKENDKLLSPTETITTGVAGAGGFRGGIAASNKKNGILLNQGSSGTGLFEIIRINLEIKEDGTAALKDKKIKEYMLGDKNVSDGESAEIVWYKIDDLSPIESLKSGKLEVNKKQEEQSKEQETEKNVEPKKETKETAVAKVDNNTVFQGTLRYLSDNEILKFQKTEDTYDICTGEKMAVLVFDNKIKLTALSSGGSGPREGEAQMIVLEDFKNASKCDGKKIKVKIKDLIWPSDVSVPIGEPRAISGRYKIVK